MQRRFSFLLIAIAGSLLPLGGGGTGSAHDKNLPKELQPRLFTLKGKDIPLSEALEKLYGQTGNRVLDRRKNKADVKLTLDLDQVPFWQGVESISRASGAGISLYEADGRMALVDRSPRPPPPTVYAGLFRLAIKRVGVTRDEESGAHTCAVNLEVAWEPRFQPFYIQVGPKDGAVSAKFAPDAKGVAKKAELPERGQMPVAGRLAVEDILLLPAPDRTSPRIDLLKGSIRAIGVTKMLTFTFDLLKKTARDQEGVKVSVIGVEKEPDRWLVEVLIENPPGGPAFSSHQSWLNYNVVYLEKGQGDKKEYFEPADAKELDRDSQGAARIVYHFTTPKRRPPSGRPEDWRLVYRTPARIVELTVPFEFKNVALP